MKKLALTALFLALIACALTGPASPARLPTLTPTAPPTATAAPTATVGPTATPIIYSFEGFGDDVVQFNSPAAGLASFSFLHLGDGNFIVKLLDSQGNNIALLVNDIGKYEGNRVEQLQPGEYILEISANGAWGAGIAPPQ